MIWKTAKGWRKAHLPFGESRWCYAYCWAAPFDSVGWIEAPEDMEKCQKCLKAFENESEVKT